MSSFRIYDGLAVECVVLGTGFLNRYALGGGEFYERFQIGELWAASVVSLVGRAVTVDASGSTGVFSGVGLAAFFAIC